MNTEQTTTLLRLAVESVSRQGFCITDYSKPEHPIVYVNRGFEELTGYTLAEIVGRNCRFLQGPKTDRAVVDQIREAIRNATPLFVELLNYRKDGTPFWNDLSLAPVFNDKGWPTHFVAVQTDVTPFKELETQFHQAQKLEAVGQLAGGVAHDFNNLLTVINGFSEILLAQLPVGDFKRDMIAEINKAGERAGTLTKQLLAFSRKQVLEPQVLDLNAVVTDTEKMLSRLIGEDISIATDLASKLGRVKVDPGQMAQVLMNLAVNARDAMPTGGKLTITTRNVTIDDAFVKSHPSVKSGYACMLAVTDTGTGMDDATKARIFEPFFTTKEQGKGTGLGLAIVFGIVNQSGGAIHIDSELGRGSTFSIYLPQVKGRLSSSKSNPDLHLIPPGFETVLVIEDEEAVRALIRHILQSCGYTVLEAADGKAALELVAARSEPLDLVVADVVMPHLSGRELVDRLQETRPGLRILFLSGYADDAVVRHGVTEGRYDFLAKPFTTARLSQKVREILDRKAKGEAS